MRGNRDVPGVALEQLRSGTATFERMQPCSRRAACSGSMHGMRGTAGTRGGTNVFYTGWAPPGLGGEHLLITLERKGGGRWRSIATGSFEITSSGRSDYVAPSSLTEVRSSAGAAIQTASARLASTISGPATVPCRLELSGNCW